MSNLSECFRFDSQAVTIVDSMHEQLRQPIAVAVLGIPAAPQVFARFDVDANIPFSGVFLNRGVCKHSDKTHPDFRRMFNE